jgi:anti-sigma factor RsiW
MSCSVLLNCAAVRPYLQAFVDDELSPERCIEIEQHLAQCSECQAEVELTRSLCRATRASVVQCPMCPDVQARLAKCLQSETSRFGGHFFEPLSFKVIAPLSAAAALTLFLSARGGDIGSDGWRPNVASAAVDGTRTESARGDTAGRLGGQEIGGQEMMEATAQDSSLMDFLIRHHASRFEPEVIEAGSVNHLEPHLGFRVQPPDFGRYGARFEGANLVPVNRTRAAVLHYNLGGKRVTLYVYNPEELPLRAQRALTPRVVGNRAVFVGHRRGYSIATCEREGVGYAVTTDLSGEESAELVAALDL